MEGAWSSKEHKFPIQRAVVIVEAGGKRFCISGWSCQATPWCRGRMPRSLFIFFGYSAWRRLRGITPRPQRPISWTSYRSRGRWRCWRGRRYR